MTNNQQALIPDGQASLSDRAAGSPFDALRRTRADGSEYWSARDLMPHLGYSTWQHFEAPLQRAIRSAANQGFDTDSLFTGSRKNSTGGRPAEDFELARFAAYLVAMNGDPNKPEVAAAQAYFAVRTREAEVQALPPDDFSTLDGIGRIIQAAQEAYDRARLATARAIKAEATVGAIEAAEGITARQFHKHYFSDVGEREFFEVLYHEGLLIDQRGSRGRDDDGRLKNGHEHRHPGWRGKPYFYLHGALDRDGVRRETTRVRPGEPELELARFLAGKGLPLNSNSKPHLYPKEISA